MLPIIPVLKGALVAAAVFTAHPAHVPPPDVPAAVVVHHAPAPQAPQTYTVKSGDTLSGIAAAHHLPWPGLWGANFHVIGQDPDVIVPGEVLALRTAPAPQVTITPAPASSSPDQETPASRTISPASTSSWAGSGPVTPGSSYEACVIARESSGDAQVMNASGHYGLYQFDLPTWESGGGSAADFGHASPAEQQQVFRVVYAARGTDPWSPSDHC